MLLDYQKDLTPAHRGLFLFGRSLFFSLFAILTAYLLFPSQSGIVSIFLLSFSLTAPFDFILDKNRVDIWKRQIHPTKANAEMAMYLLILFLGTFVIFLLSSLFLPLEFTQVIFSKQLTGAPTQIQDIHFGELGRLFFHNVTVLLIFFFFSLLYRTGAIFVLGWNASVWGTIFGVVATNLQARSLLHFIGNYVRILAAITPHLLLEALAYVLASMSGLYLSKAAIKYQWLSPRFNRVLKAVLIIFILSLLTLLLAALFESKFAPWLLKGR